MFVVFGSYNAWPKNVAFRRDYCVRCQRERLVLAKRTWDFGHLFWIPVLPMGRWTRWLCPGCGQDPAVATSIRKPFRIMLAFILGLLLIPGGFALTADDHYSAEMVWVIRAGVVLAMAALVWWAFRPDGTKEMRDRRAAVQPWSGQTCPVCDAHMMQSIEGARCSGCDIEHRPLEKKDETVALYS